jgi:hypothetical protein
VNLYHGPLVGKVHWVGGGGAFWMALLWSGGP